MTVTTTANSITYAGNSTTTAFAFPCIFFEPTDLVVTLFNTATNANVSPAPVLNGGGTYGYTVTGTAENGEYASGAAVTFNTAPAAGLTVIINRVVPALQEVTLIDNAKFPADTVNTEFDKLTVLAQQAEYYASRLALHIPVGETNNTLALPSPVRAGYLLTWDTAGNLAQSHKTLADIESGVTPIPTPSNLIGVFNVMDFGAVGDGVTDDSAAFNAAFAAASLAGGGLVVAPPSKRYRIAAKVEQPANTTFDGGNFIPGNPAEGCVIVADVALAIAWQMGAGGNNGTATLRNITISRAGLSPATSTIGIKIFDGYNVQFQNVMSDNHGICWFFTSHALPSGAGISAHLQNCYSYRATDCFVVNDAWPELYWDGGRFGGNGADYTGNAYVRTQGGFAGTAGGPNTTVFMGVQFNTGSTAMAHFWEFVNLTPPGVPSIDVGNFKITDCHIEGVSGAVFYSDATWNAIILLYVTNCMFNNPSAPFLALNAATTIGQSTFTNCVVAASSFTLTPAAQQISALAIIGGLFNCPMTITSGSAGSSMSMSAVTHGDNCTLAGAWGSLSRHGCAFQAGSLVSTATGLIDIDDVQSSQGSWAPTLAINDSGTGITYSSQAGHYQVSGRLCTASFDIALTSKGASVGNVRIYNIPFAATLAATGTGGGGVVSSFNNTNLAGTTGTIMIRTFPGSTISELVVTTAGGLTFLTDTHLNNNTTLSGTFSYMIR